MPNKLARGVAIDQLGTHAWHLTSGSLRNSPHQCSTPAGSVGVVYLSLMNVDVGLAHLDLFSEYASDRVNFKPIPHPLRLLLSQKQVCDIIELQ
jgi:hypothetical protein